MKKTTLLLSIILILLAVQLVLSQSMARYTFAFTSTWNSTDHGTLPGSAHWSDLVGATHNNNITFWEPGQLATQGIEDVAELGSNTNFNSEVNTAIGNGDADQWLQASFSPFAAISSATLSNIIVSSDFPLLTLASMVAPSPDWFVGVSGFSLLDTGGNWKPMVTTDMFVYDAGTEDGTTYSTSNPDSNPQVDIFSRVNMTPFNDQRIGYLTIMLDEVLNVPESDFDRSVRIYPNPVTDVIHIYNPLGHDIARISIYDMIGNRVSELTPLSNDTYFPVNRNGLNSGLYLIAIQHENGSVSTRKLVLK
ncbi:MAG: spondin domain-containing protein [Bacteroidia bacterium]|nr:spondin domain-containing protein [Bacteroidia bacterium]NNK72304.1 T9SS type A sorting domain-containing protein [Flavobacteriaceae bacterium]